MWQASTVTTMTASPAEASSSTNSVTHRALAMVAVAVIRSLVNWDPESGHKPVKQRFGAVSEGTGREPAPLQGRAGVTVVWGYLLIWSMTLPSMTSGGLPAA